MENEQLDLTLKLGLPSPTVDTHLTLATTANTNQRSSVVGGCGNNNVDVNTRVYNFVFQHFAGTGETLNFATFSMPPCPAPAPVTPPVSYSGGRIEVARKCTNKNCNAIDTPLWRRGPHGPKSLCNACGIKFRKEEERRAKRN